MPDRPALLPPAAAVMFLSTIFRFRYKSATLVWMFFGLTYAITTAASYHAQSKQWKFTVFWFAYSAVGGAVAYLCATFVLPVTAGGPLQGGPAGQGPEAAVGRGGSRTRWASSPAGASRLSCCWRGARQRNPACVGPHLPLALGAPQAPLCGGAWPPAWSSPLTP